MWPLLHYVTPERKTNFWDLWQEGWAGYVRATKLISTHVRGLMESPGMELVNVCVCVCVCVCV
jgi:hypothetical protein